jgi:hypothetical protein
MWIWRKEIKSIVKKILKTCLGNYVWKKSTVSFRRIYSENILMKGGGVSGSLASLSDITRSVPCSSTECELRFSIITVGKLRTELLIVQPLSMCVRFNNPSVSTWIKIICMLGERIQRPQVFVTVNILNTLISREIMFRDFERGI